MEGLAALHALDVRMKGLNRNLVGMVAILLGLTSLGGGEERNEMRILEILISAPLKESFAIETIFSEDPGGNITVRQFRPVIEKLDTKRPDLEMFELELVEFWNGDVRTVKHEDEMIGIRIGPRPIERLNVEELVRKLWDRGDHQERRGNEFYVVKVSQQNSSG